MAWTGGKKSVNFSTFVLAGQLGYGTILSYPRLRNAMQVASSIKGQVSGVSNDT
jgi:hypothetical protein